MCTDSSSSVGEENIRGFSPFIAIRVWTFTAAGVVGGRGNCNPTVTLKTFWHKDPKRKSNPERYPLVFIYRWLPIPTNYAMKHNFC